MDVEDKKISLYIGSKTFLEVWEMARRDCPDALPYLDMLMAEVEEARRAKAAEAVEITLDRYDNEGEVEVAWRARHKKARRVEAAFDTWLDGRTKATEWNSGVDNVTYQSVFDDGKDVMLDGRFSVDALRELLRLIDETWPGNRDV